MIPTSGWLVLTCWSWWTRSRAPAQAVTSSVDSIQVPAPSRITSCTASAEIRIRQSGIGRTRRGVSSTSSTAEGWGSALAPG